MTPREKMVMTKMQQALISMLEEFSLEGEYRSMESDAMLMARSALVAHRALYDKARKRK
jgi:hypothetical protein